MKNKLIGVAVFSLTTLQSISVQGQNMVSTTGYLTDEKNVTMMVSQQFTTR